MAGRGPDPEGVAVVRGRMLRAVAGRSPAGRGGVSASVPSVRGLAEEGARGAVRDIAAASARAAGAARGRRGGKRRNDDIISSFFPFCFPFIRIFTNFDRIY